MAKKNGGTKADILAKKVAEAVNAGKAWNLETVDFSDPNRPLTCLEVDFPILPINEIAAIEGNAGKPIYQMSKWWARRRSSVFRAMLIAAATKAPEDKSEAAKIVWDAYYGNHQKNGAFKHLKVADIFMGGGTTVVEGSRLGMQMYGNDLNPVAWFVVKNAMAKVDKDEVQALLDEIERDVKPQIMPFYTCDCPRGHKGKWLLKSTGKVMSQDFDPAKLAPEDRKAYEYSGPEIIYVFWAKHGPCSAAGCGHRTPIMSSPVIAVKSLSIKYWAHRCKHCQGEYELEEKEARMAPGVPLVVADSERAHAILQGFGATCPHCKKRDDSALIAINQKSKKKLIRLSLLTHPEWMKGESSHNSKGIEFGGRSGDLSEHTIDWNSVRSSKCRLLEFRGELPKSILWPGTSLHISTDASTTTGRGNFICGTCGRVQSLSDSLAASGVDSPVAMYAIHGYCPQCARVGEPYGGRFFDQITSCTSFDSSLLEWEVRRVSDLSAYWPQAEIVFSHMTHERDPLPKYGIDYWWKMFNPRQTLTLSLLLSSITNSHYSQTSRDFVLGLFQQYLRNQNIFCFWDIGYDKLVPHLSNNNFHPKNNFVENGVFSDLGRGNWQSCIDSGTEALKWRANPWELVSNTWLEMRVAGLDKLVTGKSEKTHPGDSADLDVRLSCSSSTELTGLKTDSYDLVVTDPPFGGNLQYAELADFFYVWLRLSLQESYAKYFSAPYTPKTLEALTNRARNKKDPEGFYKRVLTDCWKEANRILKPGGLLAFTFHHSEDAPWVSVLESLFDAGFYLEATYPIRSDETKGEGEFGSKKIEYDIIHVCRKRTEDPKPISWAMMRRQVIQDVKKLQEMLEHHQKAGLPEADLQVMRRGKALEYFSRHYGKVYKDEDTPIDVLEALVGINQLLDEEAGGIKEPPPHNAEPFTRMFLRMFDGRAELPRDQMQKYLRGSGSAPSDFENRGWCFEEKKVFYLTPPLKIAQGWLGKQKKNMTSDYDQAAFLIGSCMENSGIVANETLNNPNFRPRPALSKLLMWHKTHGATNEIRNAAGVATSLFKTWEAKHKPQQVTQTTLFFDSEDE